jgi:hypothetical protein
MRNYEEQFQFILRFIEEDLEALSAQRPGTFQDLQRDLETFVEKKSASEWTVPILQALQAEIRDNILDFVAARNIREMRGQQEEPHTEVYLFPKALKRAGDRYAFPFPDPTACVHWLYQQGQFFPTFHLDADRATVDISTLANRFLWKVCVILSKISADHVRVCRPEECGRYFYAEHGNQWFCSPSCANKARTKRYRDRNPTKDKEV